MLASSQIEIGCDLKVGWNLKNDVGNSLMFSAAQNRSFWDDMMAYIYVGADGRGYLYNHLLEGSFLSNKDDKLKVDIEPFVGELQCGACVKYKDFSIRYYMVFRSDEFKHQRHAPNYAGLVFGYEF